MSSPTPPLTMDAKTKFQQLWSQFGTRFVEEPMRDQEKRVEELVRENERLRLELLNSKAENTKQLDETKQLSEENETLRDEVSTEVRSGIERVQERNMALAAAKKKIAGLEQAVLSGEAIWQQERSRYKQTVKLLKDELEITVRAYERLRKNVGILSGEVINSDDSDESLGEEHDDDEDDEREMANQAELQLQAERSLQSGAYRRATRRRQVEETPGADEDEHDENEEPEDDEAEEYLNGEVEGEEEDDDDEYLDGEEEEEEGQGNGTPENRESLSLEPEDEAEDGEEEVEGEEEEEEEQEQPLRRSTRIRHTEPATEADSANATETIEVVGTKRGRDESSDRTTTDGASQIPDRQTEYRIAASTDSQDGLDPTDRPAKRTRRQTERYINALETTKHMAKIMTPPATSPPFLPSVLPRRSTNRSPTRRTSTLSQSQSQTSTPKPTTPRRRRAPAAGASATKEPLKSPSTTPKTKSPTKAPNKSPSKAPTTRSPRSPRNLKNLQTFPKVMFDFTLISGFKHGRNLMVDDPEIRDSMEPLLQRTTERIREVANTPGFWRSYAHKRNIQRVDSGLSRHCAFTSQFPLDSDKVEVENPWSNGEDFACDNCIKEGIACFTVGDRIDTEKYGATYRPPKLVRS
ncbi:hypothetical protein TWF694_006296 [Orbilia ellipsospora]|uniref:Uncharacterized protein n=1 Tax=Orbilia ellipsospora TaxID=2528407 RepID=A0AAV9XL60_9PEZI